MKTMIGVLPLFLASAAVPGQIDIICREYCRALAIQGGAVRFIDQAHQAARSVAIGGYVAAAQRLVPRTEAPIRELRSPRGWHVVVSAFLHHDADNEGEAGVHIRFFDSNGANQLTDDVPVGVDQMELGRPFGGSDELFAISAEEEHAYNVETEIWFLPEQGRPKLVMTLPGVYEKFVRAAGNQVGGVRVARETYDGEHSETKGRVQEFWSWDANAKSLIHNER
jgi:hypothetical protein